MVGLTGDGESGLYPLRNQAIDFDLGKILGNPIDLQTDLIGLFPTLMLFMIL